MFQCLETHSPQCQYFWDSQSQHITLIMRNKIIAKSCGCASAAKPSCLGSFP